MKASRARSELESTGIKDGCDPVQTWSEDIKTCIIVGNYIMNDDAAGLHVARRLRELVNDGALDADIIESAVAGYDLIEMVQDWDRVVLVEAVKFAGRQATFFDSIPGPTGLRFAFAHSARRK